MDIGEAISTILFHLLTMSREPAKAQMQIQHTGPKRGMQSFGLLVSGSQAYMGFNFFFFCMLFHAREQSEASSR